MTFDEELEKIWKAAVDNRAYSETLSDITPYPGETIPDIMSYVVIDRHDGQKISPYLYLKG